MDDAELLEDLLDQWEEAKENGHSIDAETLCSQVPHLLPKLKEQIKKLEGFDDRATLNLVHTQPSKNAPEQELSILSSLTGLNFVGEGSLGVVYSANDRALHRRLAIKFLRERFSGDTKLCTDFVREAEITSRLDHPGVVPVLGIGKTDDGGRLFYAMRYVDGNSFDIAINELHEGTIHFDDTKFRNLLSSFVSICKTVAYAHSRGIIHRDLKPENIMIGKYGETLVVDWGLAIFVDDIDRSKFVESLRPITKSAPDSEQQRAGTPAFMAPEQFENTPSIEFASDIYSLGGVLYNLITNEIPIDAESLSELKTKKLSGQIPPTTNHQPQVPAALNAICMKALATVPHERYATAMELAKDVERFLSDEPIEAHQDTAGQRFSRWLRHNAGVVQAGIMGLIVLIFVSAVFSVGLYSYSQGESEARQSGILYLSELAAQTLAGEMNRRFLVLGSTAQEPEFKNSLAECLKDPKDEERWAVTSNILNQRAKYYSKQYGIESYAWFVALNDGLGTQIARAPERKESGERYSSLGKSYIGREYFHGLGPKPIDDTSGIKPLRKPHLTAPFLGTHSEFVLAFSIPVFQSENPTDDEEPMAVIGMAVQLGNLTQLKQKDGLALAYANEVYFDRLGIKGMIIQHQAYESGEVKQLNSQYLERILTQKAWFSPNYQDPMAEVDPALKGDWLAGMTLVELKDNDWGMESTGWIVIVQERP
jgi:serine/threonine protein kinase